MAEILGLTVSHFPYLRFKYWAMPSVMRGLVGGPWADKVPATESSPGQYTYTDPSSTAGNHYYRAVYR